ncbi:MAG TPA: RT0821/Lpp0805 family surface protein [Steroidobacteraceae bacterium]|nr:RT0821/Lpp0805 family surface protein [Steroidobacteraceae bacterium]
MLGALPAADALAQGNLGFLKNTPYAYFRGDDSKLMRAAAMGVLKDAKPGNTQSWQNPATGNSGTITLDKMFTGTNGEPCGVLIVASKTRQVSGDSTMTACQRADGQWALATDQGPN